MKHQIRLKHILLLLLILAAHPAQAQFFNGPASAATGNAGRASVDQGETVFLNPASLAFLQHYVASGYYGVNTHPIDGDSTLWGVSLADGSTDNIVPGGLSYVHRLSQLNGVGDTQQDIQVSLAGLPTRTLAIGFSAHMLKDQMLSNFAGNDYTQYNGVFGLLWVPVNWLGLAAVASDVLPIPDTAPDGVHLVPTYALGVNFIYSKAFHLRFDVERPDTDNPGRRNNYGGGLETYFADSFVFRAGGYWRETADETYVTAGIGYLGPKLSLDYSFQQDLRNAANSRHLIDLWIPL